MAYRNHILSSFDRALEVSAVDLEFLLRSRVKIPWADFELNPRRLRGSDFLMRWSQGVWSEQRVIQAVNATGKFFALPYGPSGVAPQDDPKAFELYFERLDRAGLTGIKRPDLLIFREQSATNIKKRVADLGGEKELPFTPEDDSRIADILKQAILAVECENSLWKASQMPHYGAELRPQSRLMGQLGLPKNAVAPTIIVKEEDRSPLATWQRQRGIPIHVWHIFYDLAFGLAFDDLQRLVKTGQVVPTEQVFQAPNGVTTKKTIYKVFYYLAYPVGKSVREPSLVPAMIIDKNGHVLPYVRFEGGELALSGEAIKLLESL